MGLVIHFQEVSFAQLERCFYFISHPAGAPFSTRLFLISSKVSYPSVPSVEIQSSPCCDFCCDDAHNSKIRNSVLSLCGTNPMLMQWTWYWVTILDGMIVQICSWNQHVVMTAQIGKAVLCSLKQVGPSIANGFGTDSFSCLTQRKPCFGCLITCDTKNFYITIILQEFNSLPHDGAIYTVIYPRDWM